MSTSATMPSTCSDTDLSPLAQKYGIPVEKLRELTKRAIAAKETSYCPYSKFRVGAAIMTEDGAFTSGANVENASYPVGTCAERCAGVKAITEGHLRFKALAVATDISPPASPCGMCRQFIREFAPLNLPILMLDKHAKCIAKTLDELLPMSFGPDDLKHQHGTESGSGEPR